MFRYQNPVQAVNSSCAQSDHHYGPLPTWMMARKPPEYSSHAGRPEGFATVW